MVQQVRASTGMATGAVSLTTNAKHLPISLQPIAHHMHSGIFLCSYCRHTPWPLVQLLGQWCSGNALCFHCRPGILGRCMGDSSATDKSWAARPREACVGAGRAD